MSAWRSSEVAADKGQVAISVPVPRGRKSRVSEGIGRHLDLLWCGPGRGGPLPGATEAVMACRGDQRRVERPGPGSDRVAVLMLTHPVDQLVKAHGAGEVVTLECIAAVAPEQFELFAVLHALGHHRHAQLAGGGDDAAADGGVLAVGDDIRSEERRVGKGGGWGGG